MIVNITIMVVDPTYYECKYNSYGSNFINLFIFSIPHIFSVMSQRLGGILSLLIGLQFFTMVVNVIVMVVDSLYYDNILVGCRSSLGKLCIMQCKCNTPKYTLVVFKHN